MRSITDEKQLRFNSYSEYATFVKNFGGNEICNVNEALYEALINNDLTLNEAKNFLTDELTIDYLTEIRLYKNKVVFQFEGVEFSDEDIAENYSGGFTIGYNFEKKQWFWIDLF